MRGKQSVSAGRVEDHRGSDALHLLHEDRLIGSLRCHFLRFLTDKYVSLFRGFWRKRLSWYKTQPVGLTCHTPCCPGHSVRLCASASPSRACRSSTAPHPRSCGRDIMRF